MLLKPRVIVSSRKTDDSLKTPNRLFHSATTHLAAKRDYYEVLGISKSATAKDVKKAYYQVSFVIASYAK